MSSLVGAMNTVTSGLALLEKNMQVISNNLANMNTIGFKRNLLEAHDMGYQSINQSGAGEADAQAATNNSQVGMGAKVANIHTVQEQGSLQEAEGPLNVAIQGRGYLRFENNDNEMIYSRDGALSLNSEGQIVNSLGHRLQGENGPIIIPADTGNVTILENGEVVASRTNEENTETLGVIQLATFLNAGGLEKIGGNMYRANERTGEAELQQPTQNGAGKLLGGFLEASNVNLISEMTNMIAVHRSYDVQSSTLKKLDEAQGTFVNKV